MRNNDGDPASERIYRLAWEWVSQVIPNHDSVLTPGEKIWTPDTLDELEAKFVNRPDASGKSFLAKLQDQLSDASPEAVQLMAELHLPFFWWVWEGAISASRKVSDLNAILSWHPERPTLPAEVAASMSPGIAHPGQWRMSRRDTQLACLVRIAKVLATMPPTDLAVLLEDPYAFRQIVLSVPSDSADAARHGLMHLVFPDTFESITSPQHKRAIIDRFPQHAGDEVDVDRGLLRVREALSGTYGTGFDFYSEDADPLVHLWLRDKRWDRTVEWLRRLGEGIDLDHEERDYKIAWVGELHKARTAVEQNAPGWVDVLRRALGHPGTNLLGWRVRGTFDAWVKTNPDTARGALLALWEEQPGSPVRQRVDAFAEAVRPAGITTVGAAVNLASVLLMALGAERHPPLKVEATRKVWRLAGWGNEPAGSPAGRFVERAYTFFDEVLRDAAAWPRPPRDRLDVQGAVWTLGWLSRRPDSWDDTTWEAFRAFQDGVEVDPDPEPVEPEHVVATKDHIASAARDLHVDRAFLDKIVTLLEDKGQVVLYGPPGTGKTFVAKRLARALAEDDPARMTVVQFHPATTYEDFFEGLRPSLTEGSVRYELRRGPLSRIAKAAREQPDRRFVMVIDELNRANLPKVFGELLFLLEYRDERVATLYRPEEQFELPTNVFFIATMNTADRSVALVDAALRRRFHFVPFFPHLGDMKGLLRRWLTDHGLDTAVADMLDAVNAELAAHVGDHMVIGPSHFMKEDLSEGSLERIWEFNIYPTLEELLWGRTQELAAWRWPAVRTRYAATLRLAGGLDEGETVDGVVTPGAG